MARIAALAVTIFCLLLACAAAPCASGAQVPHFSRRLLQDVTSESTGTGVGPQMGTPTGRGTGIQGTGVSGGTGAGMGLGGAGVLGGAGPGSSNSGWNSGGSGSGGTGIGDYGRATAGSTATPNPGCILEESGNMAITSCMQAAGKRRMLHV